MALLHDIQQELLNNAIGVGSILLKFRFLASKLDVDILEEWVQYETEGYPNNVPVPDYRLAQITYTGTFSGIAQQINNVSIPSQLIEKFAGKEWLTYQIRDGLLVIDNRLNAASDTGHFAIDSSNLKLILQNKIYQGMSIVEINNRIDTGEFTGVQQAVRAKALDFALKLEKQVPAASEIFVGNKSIRISASEQENVTHLTQKVFLGDVTSIHADVGSAIAFSVIKGSRASLTEALEAAGMSSTDAKEFSEIAGDESPPSATQPIGKKTENWLKKKLKGSTAEFWHLGKATAREVIVDALKQYYGLM
ncbi:MAG: hypothetical protein OXC93_03985 [Rhodospirillaceae bacterium]|nr:hypothetical protein [Rhodospirillaceae bacterium]